MSMKSPMKICGVAVLLLLLTYAALGPAKLQLRTGLGWRWDHFVVFFVFTMILCFTWPRPFVIGGAFMALSMLLEGLQAFTPHRHASLEAALYGASGAFAAALFADCVIRAGTWLSGSKTPVVGRVTQSARTRLGGFVIANRADANP